MTQTSSKPAFKLPEKFMVSSSDGNLYDTTKPGWTEKPVRRNYSQHHRTIKSCADFKATIRAGRAAWPGGYSVLFVTSDGGLLCYDCAKKHARAILGAIKDNYRVGWKVESSCIEAVGAECVKDHNRDNPDNEIQLNNCDTCSTEFGELS